MRKFAPLLTSVSLAGAVCACAWHGPDLAGPNMPRSTDVNSPASDPKPFEQEVLSSARHWELVAADVARGICDPDHELQCRELQSWTSERDKNPTETEKDLKQMEENLNRKEQYLRQKEEELKTEEEELKKNSGRPLDIIFEPPPCVKVASSPVQSMSPAFPTLLRTSLIRELVDRKVKVYAPESPIGCDRVEIHATVVKLTGVRHTGYYVGEYAALAQGVIAVRNVARTVSTEIIAPTILGAEIAYWLSPNYLTRHPMAEVAISISRISIDGRYVSEYTNVYYIDARDVDAYQSIAKTIASDTPSPILPVASTHLTEVPLPILSASQNIETKLPFTGTKPFRTAGSVAAYLIGASADGTTVVGNTKFADGHWHVATMTAKGAAVDLGAMGGVQACATAVSDDGNVIVGLVELASAEPFYHPLQASTIEVGCNPEDHGQWAAFKWQNVKDGFGTTETFVRPKYAAGNVQAVFVSADGSVVLATALDTALTPRSHVVRWKSSTTSDSFAAAWPQNSQSCPPQQSKKNNYQPNDETRGAPANCNCHAEGVSKDGTEIAFSCSPVDSPKLVEYYLYSENRQPDADVHTDHGDFATFQLANTVNQGLIVSSDLGTAIGHASAGSTQWLVARSAQVSRGGPLIVPPCFIPTGLSADGGVILGHIKPDPQPGACAPVQAAARSSPPPAAAAVWYAANGPIELPLAVFAPRALDVSTSNAQGNCAFVAGDFVAGALLLVNEVSVSAHCNAGNGAAAWVVAP
jgi:uncharacterized membrane protein